MLVKEIKVDSVIKKITKKDNLFKGDYTIDFYQNCDFSCIYCDSSYDKTIYVKTNAVEILDKELKNLPKGKIIVGSVNDPYQSCEKRYCITRKILEIIQKHNFSCHVLTKSNLVLRDMDLLMGIKNCIVTVSIVSLKNKNSNFFEKNVPSPNKRLKVVEKLNKNGIYSGIAIMPFLPFIGESEIKNIFQEAKKFDIKYILYKILELKGDQKQKFLKQIKNFNLDLIEKYEKLYNDCYYPNKDYIKKIDNLFNKTSKKYNIKLKI
jgi:DNA repair photolyase